MGYSIREGYVVYQRGEDSNPYWKRIHRQAIAGVDDFSNLFPEEKIAAKYASAGSNLVSLGVAEQEKELQLIRAAGFDVQTTDDIKNFITNFNEVLMGAEQFKKAKERIKEAVNKKNTGKKKRAPTIASFFSSYLGTALNKNITAFAGKAGDLTEIDFSAWEETLDNIIDKSIMEAFEQMLTKVKMKEGEELYGDSEEWQELFKLSQSMDGFNQYFIQMIRSKINFNNLRDIFKDESIKLKNKKKKGIRAWIDGKKGLNLKNEKKARSIGGSVQEYIMTLLNSIGSGMQNAASGGSRVLTSEIAKTDNIQLFSYSAKISSEKMAQEIVDAMDSQLQDSTSLRHTAQIMDDFYAKHLSELDNSFIVYGSTKSYSLSDSFRGFSGGSSGSLEQAKAVLAAAGVGGSGLTDAFINAAYNTGAGAYLSGKRGVIQEELKVGLMSSIAHLLFDDWTTIGAVSGGTKSIHVLQLEGINIPMSVFLIAAGKAMIDASKDMDKMVQVKVSLPGAIIYKDTIKTSDKSVVKAAWEEQAAQAKAESSYSIHFLTNFKSLLGQWI